MAMDSRTLDVLQDGATLHAGKLAPEVFVHKLNVAAWLDSRGTVSGAPTVVVSTGTGGTAPTAAVLATEFGTIVPIKVSAGTAGWVGTITVTVTSTYNAEVKEQIINYTVS